MSYVERSYGKNCTVVFDGYKDIHLSTKLAEQKRRYSTIVSPEVVVNKDTIITVKQDEFMGSNSNKNQLIELLMRAFTLKGHNVKQANDDADYLITQTAIDIAEEGSKVILVGEDIDLLTLLVSNTTATCNDIIFMKPAVGNVEMRQYDIQTIQHEIPKIQEHVLFAHAVSGCDTTSALYRKGKIKCLKILQTHDLQDVVEVFNGLNSSKEEIFKAACKYFLTLYRGNQKHKSIEECRFWCFLASASKSSMYLGSLCPTADDSAPISKFKNGEAILYHRWNGVGGLRMDNSSQFRQQLHQPLNIS